MGDCISEAVQVAGVCCSVVVFEVKCGVLSKSEAALDWDAAQHGFDMRQYRGEVRCGGEGGGILRQYRVHAAVLGVNC